MKRLFQTAIAFQFASLAVACSGEDVQGQIARVNLFSAYAAVYTGLLLIASLGLRLKLARWSGAIFLLLHPVWTLPEADGDCGFLKLNATVLIAAIQTVTVLLEAMRQRKARRSATTLPTA